MKKDTGYGEWIREGMDKSEWRKYHNIQPSTDDLSQHITKIKRLSQ